MARADIVQLMFALALGACAPSQLPSSDGDASTSPVDPSFGDCEAAVDSDGDHISDFEEGEGDADGDETPNLADEDADGDGLTDFTEAGDADLCTRPRDGNSDGYADYIDPDRDDDGLVDGDETQHSTDLENRDSDDDGFIDGVEVVAEADPTNAAVGVPEGDFYVILPYRSPAQQDTLSFQARLGRADVFFMVDTTNSMDAEIQSVRDTLSTQIVPGLRSVIADVRMGVGDFRDYPNLINGDANDWPFLVRQTLTSDVSRVASALNALRHGGGGDTPEAQIEAVYRALEDACPGSDTNYGAACFTPGRTPIFVIVTDAPSHNGPDTDNDYLFAATSYEDAVARMRTAHARILGVAAAQKAEADLTQLARDTDSLAIDGSPLVYAAPQGQIDTAVVTGIRDLVRGIPQDVTARATDVGGDEIDASRFMRSIVPVAATAIDGASADDEAFYNVPGGVEVQFQVTFENDFVPATATPQLFHAEIAVVDQDSGAELDAPRNVFVIVPADTGHVIVY